MEKPCGPHAAQVTEKYHRNIPKYFIVLMTHEIIFPIQ
jgi:hypothetical protein